MLRIQHKRIPGYEKVIIGKDPDRGLHAIIAVHSTALGPSLGGVRIRPFKNEKTAMHDVLRLSQAMSLKAAVSGLNLGGGKAVVLADPFKDKSRELFLALGELIESLKGKYIAAEDSGLTPRDLNIVAMRTRHLTGATAKLGGSGDPSYTTARGVVAGMEIAAKHKWGTRDLNNVKIAIQGVGQVGWYTAKLLHQKGALLIVSDVVRERTQHVKDTLGARVVAPDRIHKVPADIFSPCAFGGVLNRNTIPEIRAGIIAGGANNQLQHEIQDSRSLLKRNVLHAPDYVINAGGLIYLYVKEILHQNQIAPWIRQIRNSLDSIFQESAQTHLSPMQVADRHALKRIKDKRKLP